MMFFGKIPVAGIALCCAAVAACGEHLLSAEAEVSEAVPGGEISPEKTEKYAFSRTEYFDISSDAPEMLKPVSELAREVESYFIKNPRLWKILLPAPGFRVRVELFSSPGIFRISKDESGFVTLFVSGNFESESAVATMRRRLARAMIFACTPGGSPADVPAWLVCAVAEESRIGSGPGRRIFFTKKSAGTPLRSPIEFLSATEELLVTDVSLQTNAVWFLRSVPGVFYFLDTQKTDGEKFVAAFPGAFPEREFDAEAAQVFWGGRFYRLVAAAPSGIDLPEESQRVFDNALLFLIEKDGSEVRVLASDLVEFRLNEDVRRLVAEKLSEFSAHFRKVNPVWHNAFAEYGLFLEMFGNPDVDAETLAAQWDKAVLARSDALALSQDLRRALNGAK